MIQVIASSRTIRMIMAAARPIRRAQGCCAAGSLAATTEMNTMLSMPSTISMAVKAISAMTWVRGPASPLEATSAASQAGGIRVSMSSRSMLRRLQRARGDCKLWPRHPRIAIQRVSRLGATRSELLDPDVAVRRFGRLSAVDLQADDAVSRDAFVRLGVIDGLDAVDPDLHPRALAADDQLVEALGLEALGQLWVGVLDEELVPPR